MNNDNSNIAETLDQLYQQLSFSTTEQMGEKLERYIELLLEWNSFARLVSRTDENHIVSRHVTDSLSLAPFIGMGSAPDGASHLDIGAGGGFPVIPLAITLPETRFVAMERSARKSTFLRKAVSDLAISNLQVIPEGFPESVPDGSPVTVTARAVENPERVYQSIVDWLPVGCTFLCQFPKNRNELPPGFESTTVNDEWTAKGYRRGLLRLIHRAD